MKSVLVWKFGFEKLWTLKGSTRSLWFLGFEGEEKEKKEEEKEKEEKKSFVLFW